MINEMNSTQSQLEVVYIENLVPQDHLLRKYAPKGSFIAFGTSPGQRASDAGIGDNGAFISAILNHIETPGIRIEDMFKRVRNTLSTLTSNKQISWEHTSLMGDFYFNNIYIDGTFLTAYSDDAFSDSDFILTKENIIHNIISALKSHDWYVQNPAMEYAKIKQLSQHYYLTDSKIKKASIN